MTPADQYRAKAKELGALARAEPNPIQRAEFDKLSQAYLLLAEHADRNRITDMIYETLPTRGEQPQAQQQQQPSRSDKQRQ